MKLHPDSARGQYSITACGDGHVEINGRRFTHSLVVGPRHLDENWPVAGFDALDAASLKPLAAIPCDVVLLGTGRRQH
ncbi:MAG: hypothetical protein KGM95_05155, partial [Betaproteobacteria bacterium]|nr:hypothetical protein [Betaproteobacteria bacterium]